MKKYLLFISMFIFSAASAQKIQNDFPKAFIGEWKGVSKWYLNRKLKTENSIGLKVYQADTIKNIYSWQFMFYEEGGAANDRPYLLKQVDKEENHWVLEAEDGTLFECYVFGNSMQFSFTKGLETALYNIRAENGKLIEEVTSVLLNEVTQSGKGTDLSPFINNYHIKSFETAILEKVK